MTPELLYGVLSAVIFQGIYCYKDRYRIVRSRNALPASAQEVSLIAEPDSTTAASPALVIVAAS